MILKRGASYPEEGDGAESIFYNRRVGIYWAEWISHVLKARARKQVVRL